MGSLTSKPKAPAQAPLAQVVYVPAQTTTTTTNTEPQPTPEAPAPSSAEIRQSSLLSRDRSRFGTILTGFRGLLDLGGNTNKRKTLLGE